ncbi:MAG: ubiquinol-cytochrome c reductase iron-sulfur subunit [Candidatus Acidiferrales bacterium]
MTDRPIPEPAPEARPANGGPGAGRRRFLEVLLGSSLAASVVSVLYPILQFVLPPRAAELDADTVVAARVDELAPNSAKIFRFGNRPGLLVRSADGAYRAFSATCTHLDCTVQYRNRETDIWCACHNGVYDLQGRNVSGPPPRPLEAYDVHERGEEIVVARRSRA